MTAKKKKEKKVMEEKRPSLPEVVTVRKRPRTPGVTLNRLIRLIESIELKMAINFSKPNKAQGSSSITVLQLKHLTVNIMRTIRNLYDAMLAPKYFPNMLLTINMLFFGKQDSDTTDPTNYRPISLLETLCKMLERIIANRFMYFLEHHTCYLNINLGLGNKGQHSR